MVEKKNNIWARGYAKVQNSPDVRPEEKEMKDSASMLKNKVRRKGEWSMPSNYEQGNCPMKKPLRIKGWPWKGAFKGNVT